MLSASTRFQESILESWVRAPAFRVNSESLVRDLFSRLNSGILGPGTRFQKSALESWVQDLVFQESTLEFSDRDFLSGVGTGFKSQLWNLGLGHPFSGVNSGIFGPAPAFRNQLWYHGSGHLFQEAILVFRNQLQEFWWGTCFQESTLESWARGPDVVGSQLWDLGLKPFFGVGNLLSGAGSGGSGIIGWNLGPCVGPAVFSRLGSLVFRSQRHLFPMESLLRHLF